MLKLPEILNLPPKLLPFALNIGKYRYYLADGGRGSGKSQAFGRLILYVCEKRRFASAAAVKRKIRLKIQFIGCWWI